MNLKFMNQTWKIVIAVIITAIIIGGGAYYWQKTALPTSITEEVNEVRDKLPLANNPAEQPKIAVPTKTSENPDETTNWKTYSGIGVTISYPNDETYTVDEKGINPGWEGFTITQEQPGNRIHVYKNYSSTPTNSGETKVINGITYKVFHREGMGSGYGYVIERNGQFYTFESVWGPKNEVFELMMTTVKFE